MPVGAITNYIDVAQLVLWVFWFFFLRADLLHPSGRQARGLPGESLRVAAPR
jgi:hypothetical protein